MCAFFRQVWHDHDNAAFLIIVTDGGGTRGYASLYMLKHLMAEVAIIEQNHQEPHYSSFPTIMEWNETQLQNSFHSNLVNIEESRERNNAEDEAPTPAAAMNMTAITPPTASDQQSEVHVSSPLGAASQHTNGTISPPVSRRTTDQRERVEGNGTRTSLYNRVMSMGGIGHKESDSTELGRVQIDDDTNGYWPCHYFDYIAGTSTGGLVYIITWRTALELD